MIKNYCSAFYDKHTWLASFFSYWAKSFKIVELGRREVDWGVSVSYGVDLEEVGGASHTDQLGVLKGSLGSKQYCQGKLSPTFVYTQESLLNRVWGNTLSLLFATNLQFGGYASVSKYQCPLGISKYSPAYSGSPNTRKWENIMNKIITRPDQCQALS